MSNNPVWLRLAAVILLALGVLLGLSAQAAPTTPTADFTDNNDGTVTHKTTGLTWKRCAEGMTWSGGTCNGSVSGFHWDQAKALTSSFAGKSDWRLPTIAELVTIVERESTGPALNTIIFPGTPTANSFWSATPDDNYGYGYAWIVAFGGGRASYENGVAWGYVRLVRGGQLLGSSGLYTPTSDFIDNGDGTVTHKKTSLTWKRCSEGQTWAVSVSECWWKGTVYESQYTWTQAKALTSNFAGKSDWRLPTQNELLSIVEWSGKSVVINATIFPNTVGNWYWSDSPWSGYQADNAWGVWFNGDADDYKIKSSWGWVRLVRGGQPSPTTDTLSSLSLSCPATLATGASGSCTTTASYSNGSSKTVNATWTSSNASVAAVSGSTVTANASVTADTPVTITASYTENGVTKTATATVTITVKAAIAALTSLSASCPATLNAGASVACTATASYSDGSSKAVNVTWTSSNTSVATVSGSTVTASASVATDTPVSLNASYTENGVTQTATAMVGVKAAIATLSSLELTCPADMTSSSSGNCSAQAMYSDGKKTAVTSATWTVTPSGSATVDASGKVTASKVTADTLVTVNVSYTENGKTVTASKTLTIKVAACLANTGEISIGGSKFKLLGESLDVRYRLCNFNKATYFDVYVAVQIPTGDMLFMSSSNSFFGTPTFTPWDGKNKPAAYLANTLVPDLEGAVLSMPVMPLTLPTGTYTFYAIPVLKGADVMNGFNWVGSLASGAVTLSK